MVSLQPSISTKERSTNWFTIFGDKSKKRKLEDNDINGEAERGGKELNLWWCTKPSSKSTSPVSAAADDIELQLEDSPLPPEWQRCLDIKSGRIHFYNTRTNKRTTKDPRCLEDVTVPPPTSRANVTIDLELNLGFESPITYKDRDRAQEQREEEEEEEKDVDDGGNKKRRRVDVTGGGRKPPEVAEHREMVAAVCIRCHMLVMMCKSSPSCPNCKYLHETTSPTRRV